ncbi:hypothetical protein LAZ67_6002037 [Cordylochernes scorpioides]|uniref:Uncharacterized protein n=1 Tax=Cordylochernes scorpioides TaxID=51811 RepID=A0ABY6KJY3_9ARAC|nr:hypothetical protein LAZ67_6002037 [Cordylochernes scorpioides]
MVRGQERHRRLRNTLRARWTWEPDSCSLSIVLLDDQLKPKTKIGPSMKNQLVGKLRQSIQKQYLNALLRKKNQGEAKEVTSQNQCSNVFIPNGRNERVLRMLRVLPKYAKLTRQLMCTDVIKWSGDIYVEHILGKRQYE